jgi:hemerythrin-like domain-containing protein
MTPTQALKEEHDGILRMLDILRAICEQMAYRKTIQGEHLDQVMGFLRIFIDRCHHGKEERFLFPEMSSANIPKKADILDDLMDEHAEGRKLVEQMGAALERFYRGDQEAPGVFMGAVDRYGTLIRDHIEKENTLLFPQAEKKISKERQSGMLEEFETLEEEEIGSGRHDQFHRQMDNLIRIYLT